MRVYYSPMMRRFAALLCAALFFGGCSSDEVTSDENARVAYLGLDRAISLAMDLGFAGFNAANSANIPEQSGAGEVDGTLVVGGKVDQGTSANKEMRLILTMIDYTDKKPESLLDEITYNTDAPSPALNLSLKGVPDGDFSGSLNGVFTMTGGLKGSVTLAVSLSGTLQVSAADASKTEREEGTTSVTGTATSDYGTYTVDLTR